MPAVALNKPAAQVEASASSGLVAEGVSAWSGPGSADGMWKLTLQKQPPPGVSLVLFVPAGSSLANGLAFPSGVPPAAPHRDIQVQHQVALPPVSSGEHRMNETSLRLDMNAGSRMQGPGCASPLDLSSKCTAGPSSVPPLPVKSEPVELEISGEAHSNKRHLTTGEESTGDAHTEVKQVKSDPMVLSHLSVSPASSGVVMAIKEEPQSPGSEGHSWPSRSCQDKEIKMEDDGSRADPEGR